MTGKNLSLRDNWQTESNKEALNTEILFQDALQSQLDVHYPNLFFIESHPQDFCDIYSSFVLPKTTLSQIYNVDLKQKNSKGKPRYQWGIAMDFAIRNKQSGKTLFGEIKRQNGWIETTQMKDGRGNAHERCCKYFTPGLQKALRNKSKLPSEILPFWIVFVGDITRDPRRNREIAFWFQGYEKNFYMWRNVNRPDELYKFFLITYFRTYCKNTNAAYITNLRLMYAAFNEQNV